MGPGTIRSVGAWGQGLEEMKGGVSESEGLWRCGFVGPWTIGRMGSEMGMLKKLQAM